MGNSISLATASEWSVLLQFPGVARPVPAALRYQPNDGLTFRLFVQESDVGFALLHKTRDYPVLHGQFFDGRAFSLFDSFTNELVYGGSGTANLVIRSNLLLDGILLDGVLDSLFEEVRIQFDTLNDWVGIEPITSCRTNWYAENAPAEANLDCKEVHGFGFSPLSGGPSLTCKHIITTTLAPKDHGEIRSNFELRIGFRAPATVEECRVEVFRVQSFLCLLSGRATCIDRVRLVWRDPDASEKVSIADYVATFARPSNAKISGRIAVLLRYSDVHDSLPIMWSKWTEKFDHYRTAVELHLSTELFDIHMPSFLLLAASQALESFHRERFGGQYVSEEEYERIRKTLVDAIPVGIPDSLRQALERRLEHGNEFSLRRRLNDLARLLDPNSRLAIHPNITDFVAQAVDARNQLTHHDFSDGRTSPSVSDVHYKACLLKWLLIAVVLKDLGVPDSVLAQALAESRDLQFVRSRLTDSK